MSESSAPSPAAGAAAAGVLGNGDFDGIYNSGYLRQLTERATEVLDKSSEKHMAAMQKDFKDEMKTFLAGEMAVYMGRLAAPTPAPTPAEAKGAAASCFGRGLSSRVKVLQATAHLGTTFSISAIGQLEYKAKRDCSPQTTTVTFTSECATIVSTPAEPGNRGSRIAPTPTPPFYYDSGHPAVLALLCMVQQRGPFQCLNSQGQLHPGFQSQQSNDECNTNGAAKQWCTELFNDFCLMVKLVTEQDPRRFACGTTPLLRDLSQQRDAQAAQLQDMAERSNAMDAQRAQLEHRSSLLEAEREDLVRQRAQLDADRKELADFRMLPQLKRQLLAVKQELGAQRDQLDADRRQFEAEKQAARVDMNEFFGDVDDGGAGGGAGADLLNLNLSSDGPG